MANSAQSNNPLFLTQTREGVLELEITEPFLRGECLHEMLWLALRDTIDQHRKPCLIIDFQNVKQVTSLTVAVLLRTLNLVDERSISMGLCEMSDGIRQVFKMLHLDGTTLSISDTKSDALSRFENRPTLFDAWTDTDCPSHLDS